MMRRYAAEFVGTFTVVFAPLGFIGAMSGKQINLLDAALVSGLAVLAMIAALGPISGAHFNPAVTLGFFATGRFPAKHVLPYILAQLGGALLAGAFSAAISANGAGVHIPSGGSPWVWVAIEMVISFFLMLVISAVATDKRTNPAVPAIAIGFTVVLGVMIGGPITGGSMNPARSLGPAAFAGGQALTHLWVYFVGPILGALAGAKTYEFLRIDPSHACGAPDGLGDPD